MFQKLEERNIYLEDFNSWKHFNSLSRLSLGPTITIGCKNKQRERQNLSILENQVVRKIRRVINRSMEGKEDDQGT